MNNKRFNLIRWFSFFGFIVIVMISISTSYILSSFLEKHLLVRDAVILEEFIVRITQQHNPANYFSENTQKAGSSLNDFFNDIAHMPDVARINAYNSNSTIIWSSDKEMVGKTFPSNHELIDALNGDVVFEKGNIEQSQKDEHHSFKQGINWFVENYIPVRDKRTGNVVGVIEIYRIPLALSQSISEGRKLVWLSVSIGGIVLFFSLFGVIRKGQFLIEDQQSKLVKQARLATIGELASSISHNIRKPIASIRSSAELALEEDCNEHVSESLNDIITEVDRFDIWIKDLLTFTNKTGKANAIASLNEVIDKSLASFQERARRHSIDIINNLPDALPHIHSEQALLTQVINSLILNSLDAMPKGGTITIEAEVVAKFVHLSIKDTGIGMSPEHMKGLFDPLVTQKRGGLGIGLALAKQVIERYKGDIRIESVHGEGTTIHIELPIVNQERGL